MDWKSNVRYSEEWNVVITNEGVVAVVAHEDLGDLQKRITLVFQAKIEMSEAQSVSDSLGRAGYMSVTCRIKAGESGGAG